ncbi:hypothetical protein PHYBOEH_001417 [Phytophthora boehmeriae]|uniref:C2H2-type domain-containing protein n=1 Tax=Phytophthora boehmeriae TaxID=109152 RepID=A0A8T1X614_9STRA|nr:hypothetical protein PHYBOEH_001417 [Phytophthora boehmeriae]
MAPLALNAKVDALSLSDHGSPTTAIASAAAELDEQLSAKSSGDSGQKKVFRCTFPGCGREFHLKGNLKRHANIHCGDKKFACKFCGKKFLRKADMEVHYRVHTGEKPYACKYQDCGKCFARRSDLLSHERTHTGRKPFACAFPGCERSFARKFDLHKHQKLHENQTSGSQKAKTKKRRLSPVKAGAKTAPPAKTEQDNCDCPSDVTTPFDGSAAGPEAVLDATVILPSATTVPVSTVPATSGCISTRFKMSPATTACLDAPRPMRYDLKCTENHIHSPPACFAALSSLDAFMLSQETLDLSRPLGLEAFPPRRPSTSMAMSCCPAHLELRPPPPDADTTPAVPTVFNDPDLLDQLFTTYPASTASSSSTLSSTGVGSTLGSTNPNIKCAAVTAINGVQQITSTFPGSAVSNVQMGQSLSDPNTAVVGTGLNAAASSNVPLNLSATAITMDSTAPTPTSVIPSDLATPVQPAAATIGASAVTRGKNKRSAEKACLSSPASSLLDYSKHKRGCGHLSIQHGNHHDYVVQNHLVCQDSVTSLGVLQRKVVTAEVKVKNAQLHGCASPQDTHRPGCGHLPVRHKDHIDYVVEDNLICQEASWLEDDNLELLGDDFWDFYGAIDSFPTN